MSDKTRLICLNCNHNYEFSKENLIALFETKYYGIRNINFPNSKYEEIFYDLLEACSINNYRFKIFALRSILEMEYNIILKREIGVKKGDSLGKVISNNKDNNNNLIFNEYIKAIWADLNRESRYAVHIKEVRGVDKEIVNIFLEIILFYLLTTYTDTTKNIRDYINRIKKYDDIFKKINTGNFSEELIKKVASIISVDNGIISITIRSLLPYLDKLPNLKKLVLEELSDPKSFLSIIKNKSLNNIAHINVQNNDNR